MAEKFFDPDRIKDTGDDCSGDDCSGDDCIHDHRLHAPATLRNRDFILDVLRDHLPAAGTVLELASGTGEHAHYFASGLPQLIWQPTDIEDKHLSSINAWRRHGAVENMRQSLYLNVLEDWSAALETLSDLSAIVAINLIHIAPWDVCTTLFTKAAAALQTGGVVYLYGPYKVGGQHTSESNADFDDSLKARNPDWGVRDREQVIMIAEQTGLIHTHTLPMPANNFSLIFRKP